MKLPWFRISILGGFILLLTACSQAGVLALTDETQSSPIASLPANTTQTVPERDEMQMTQLPPSSTMESLIEKAKEDLAQRLSIEKIEIELVEAKTVEWSDSSLGCPQPRIAYMQIITPGYLILLKHNNVVFEYHTNRQGSIIYCQNPSAPVPGKSGDTQ